MQGIAKTGSGKTAAFVLPMLVHIMDQPELEKGEGPIAIVVAPTRELSEQIHKESRRFSKPYNLRICAAFGGLSKYEQFKDLKAGAEVRLHVEPPAACASVNIWTRYTTVLVAGSLSRESVKGSSMAAGCSVYPWAHD